MPKPLLLATLMAAIVGCNSATVDEPTTETPAAATTTEQVTEPELSESKEADTPLQKAGDTVEFEGGTLELVKILDVNEATDTGPFKLTITKVSVINYEPTETLREQFGGKDAITLVSVGMDVENTSTEKMSIYPDQATLVTNTKEQLNPDFMFTENVGGDFLGEVIKNGNVVFVAESAPSDIESIIYNVRAPHDETLTPVGEEVVLEFEFE